MPIAVRVVLSLRWRARCLSPLVVLFAGATLAPEAVASGATITWTNPDGGVWSDPANWSDGVPGIGDTVIFPGLDADGYTISVDGAVVCHAITVATLAGSGPVTLSGGSVGVTAATVVGGSAGDGTLVLDGTALSSVFVDVGVNGPGALEVRNVAKVSAGFARVGFGGVGRLAVGPDATLVGSLWKLESGAQMTIAVAPETDTPIDVTDFVRGGSLEIQITPDFDLPSMGNKIIATVFGISGSFASVTIPRIDGYELPLVTGQKSMTIPAFDPILGVEIRFPELPPVVGFESDLWVEEVRYSGVTTISCWASPCAYEWSVVAGSAELSSDVLVPIGPEAITVEATRNYFDANVTASTTVPVMPESSYRYHRLAVAPGGDAPNSTVEWSPRGPRASDDGRFTVFAHRSELGTGPTCDPNPTQPDVLVHDGSTGAVECVSVGVPAGRNANPDISGNGRLVVFTNGVGNGSQVWMHDRWSGLTTRISESPTGEAGNAESRWPCISRDGSVVVFTSLATNLGAAVPAGVEQVYLYEVASGQLSLLSKSTSGEAGEGHSIAPAISADGGLVAYATSAPNLLDGASGYHILLVDRASGHSEILDRSSEGTIGNADANLPILSSSGRFVLFSSQASNLDPDDTDSKSDAFLRDRLIGTTAWVSPDFPGATAAISYFGTALTDDAESVVYVGSSPGPPGTMTFSLMRHWLNGGMSEWVSATPWGKAGVTAASLTPFTADGTQVLFFGVESAVVPFVTSSLIQPLARLFAPPQPADLNNDGFVNAADLALLLGVWGSSGGPADLDGDGTVGAGDLAVLVGAWTN